MKTTRPRITLKKHSRDKYGNGVYFFGKPLKMSYEYEYAVSIEPVNTSLQNTKLEPRS